MIGPVVDSAALALGGVAGVLFGPLIPARVKDTLPLIFGVITVCIGATLVGKASHMHVVVLALITGSFLGELCYAERGLEYVIRRCVGWSRKHDGAVDEGFIIQFITLISAFCFGSMGLFGAMNEGITNDPSILFTKAVLDLFSGIIFGATLGLRVSLIAVPQFLTLAALYFSASSIMPYVNEQMLNDFSSCGGVIFVATGLRMCGIKIFPIINMLPALLLVMPLSLFWLRFFI